MPNNVFPFFIALFILFALIFIIIRKAGKTQNTYDERQLLAHNMAYKWSFAALGFYFVSSELVTLIIETDWCTPETNIGLGVFFSISVFAVISVFKDAYNPIGGSIANSMLIFILLGGYQLFTGISDAFDNGIFKDGILNLPLPLCIGFLSVVIITAQLIKLAIDKKAVNEEE